MVTTLKNIKPRVTQLIINNQNWASTEISDTMTTEQENLSKQKIEELRNHLQEIHEAYKEEHGKEYEEDYSPLARLGEAIDNGEFSGIKSNYKCNKCNREAEWETFIGIPKTSIPCGCGGSLIIQSIMKTKC